MQNSGWGKAQAEASISHGDFDSNVPRAVCITTRAGVVRFLSQRRTVASAANIAEQAQRHAENLLSRMREDLEEASSADPRIRKPACDAGCAYCCHLRVSVLPIEVVRLRAYIDEKFDDEQRQTLISRLREYVATLASMPVMQRINAPLRCPLLDESNRCRAYEARPLACRIHNSVDAEACRKNLDDESVAVPVIPAFEETLSPVLNGLNDGCFQAGLASRDLELAPALLLALTTDAGERWIKGEDSFATAEDEEVREKLRQVRGNGLRVI